MIEDANGNEIQITSSGYVDTVGRSGGGETSTTDTSGCTGPGPWTADDITFPGYDGAILTYKLCYMTVQVGTDFNVSGVTEETAPVQALTTILRPDGTAWSFTYDYQWIPHRKPNYGDLLSVTLPTGGTINYSWTTEKYFSYGPTPTSRWLTQRVTNANDGLGDHTWIYSTNSPGYGMDVIDPSGNEADYAFTPLGDTTTPYEQDVEYFQGNGASKSPIKTVAITWQYQTAPIGDNGGTELAYALPATWTTTWADGDVSKQTRQWDYGFTYQIGSNLYDGIFGEDAVDSYYDLGQGAAGPLLKTVSRGYLNDYTQGLLDPVRVLTVTDGAGHTASETDNTYDGAPLQYDSGSWPGRDPNYSAGGGITARGNLTSQQRFGGSSPNVTLHWTYNASGDRLSTTSGNGNTTSYTFDSSDGAYLTQIVAPATTTGSKTNTHTEDLSFDTDSGLLTQAKDVENAAATKYQYDSTDRPSEVIYPDGGETTFTYTGANQIETKRLFDTSNDWADSYTVLDGLGRPQRALSYYPGLSGYCSGDEWQETDTAYNGLNQAIYRSLPYCTSGIDATPATSASQQPGDTFAFDALGRELTDAQPPVVAGQTPEITFSYADSGGVATTTQTDAAGHQRAWLRNALG